MNTDSLLYKKVVSKTIKVNNQQINEQRVLSICSMLNTITAINDEVIVSLLGSLDFGQISIDHFNLDVTSNALLNDVVTLDAYIGIMSGQRIKVYIRGYTSRGGSNTAILNGSFGFTVRNTQLLQYSLS